MSTTTISRGTTPSNTGPSTRPAHPTSPARRFFGVVVTSQSYRNIAYLLLGLPLGTVWFTVLVIGISIGISMLVVALLGIPLLLATWYITRAFANVERSTANALLGQHLAQAPMDSSHRGNLWVRLRSMTRDRDRWRELGYLMLRFPVGIATFTAAVTALATPATVAYAPFTARYGGDRPFGKWSQSSRLEDIASNSPWSWLLIPFGLLLMITAFHLLSGLARACAGWTTAWLGTGSASATCEVESVATEQRQSVAPGDARAAP